MTDKLDKENLVRPIFMLLGAICLFVTLSACQKVELHDGTAAIELTTKFLKLNSSGQFQDAYSLFDKGFTDKVGFESFAKNDVLNKDPNLGKLKRAEFEYYMLIGTQKNIELIYNCDFEKLSGVPLHFVLSGSMSDGYKITVLDVGYNYKVFGEDEPKRPHLTVGEKNVVTF